MRKKAGKTYINNNGNIDWMDFTVDEAALLNIFFVLNKYNKVNDLGDYGEDVYKFENISDEDYFLILTNMKEIDIYIDYSPSSDGLYYDDSHEIGLHDQYGNTGDPEGYDERMNEYLNLCMRIFKNGGDSCENTIKAICKRDYFIRLRHSTDGGDYCSALDNTYVDFNKGFYDIYYDIFKSLIDWENRND